MKLVCSQAELNGSLQLVSRAIAGRPTHPVLANVLVTADAAAGRISLTGFDLSLGIQTSFAAVVESTGNQGSTDACDPRYIVVQLEGRVFSRIFQLFFLQVVPPNRHTTIPGVYFVQTRPILIQGSGCSHWSRQSTPGALQAEHPRRIPGRALQGKFLNTTKDQHCVCVCVFFTWRCNKTINVEN